MIKAWFGGAALSESVALLFASARLGLGGNEGNGPFWGRISDKLGLMMHDTTERIASLQSRHSRQSGLNDISIDHLWIKV